MANFYFRSVGTAYGTAANWSTTADGLTPSASVPSTGDTIFFTALSGNCDMQAANRVIAGMDCTGYTGTFTLTTGQILNVSAGNVFFSTGMTISGTGTLNAQTGVTGTWTNNGKFPTGS